MIKRYFELRSEGKNRFTCISILKKETGKTMSEISEILQNNNIMS